MKRSLIKAAEKKLGLLCVWRGEGGRPGRGLANCAYLWKNPGYAPAM